MPRMCSMLRYFCWTASQQTLKSSAALLPAHAAVLCRHEAGHGDTPKSSILSYSLQRPPRPWGRSIVCLYSQMGSIMFEADKF